VRIIADLKTVPDDIVGKLPPKMMAPGDSEAVESLLLLAPEWTDQTDPPGSSLQGEGLNAGVPFVNALCGS
jgi:hypothetical protein